MCSLYIRSSKNQQGYKYSVRMLLLVQQTEKQETSTKVVRCSTLNSLILDSQRCKCSRPIRTQLPGHHNLWKTQRKRFSKFKIDRKREYKEKNRRTLYISEAKRKLEMQTFGKAFCALKSSLFSIELITNDNICFCDFSNTNKTKHEPKWYKKSK